MFSAGVYTEAIASVGGFEAIEGLIRRHKRHACHKCVLGSIYGLALTVANECTIMT